MFTGIITDKARVRSVERSGDTRFVLSTAHDAAEIELGASIACSGVCLTVVDKATDMGGNWFAVEVSGETLSCTTLGNWEEGAEVNLERSLKIGDELGGHFVSGHVDGVALVTDISPQGDSLLYTFEAGNDLIPYVAAKGSLALDGVSLTVNWVEGRRFGVNIIPHTQNSTTFGALQSGDRLNLEIDMLARYVARLMEKE
jgi:riboflavin synthase